MFGERSDLQLGARVSLSLSSCPSTFFFCCSRVNKGDSSVTRVISKKNQVELEKRRVLVSLDKMVCPQYLLLCIEGAKNLSFSLSLEVKGVTKISFRSLRKATSIRSWRIFYTTNWDFSLSSTLTKAWANDRKSYLILFS